MKTLPELCRDPVGFNGSLLTRTMILVGTASVLVAAIFIVVTLLVTEHRAQQQAGLRLDELIEASGSMAGIACFANDKVLGQETAQAIVKSSDVSSVVIRCGERRLELASQATTAAATEGSPVVRAVYSPFDSTLQVGEIAVVPNGRAIDRAVTNEVRYVGIALVLFSLGIFVSIALATNHVILKPVKAISDGLHSSDVRAGTSLLVPARHARNELGRLVRDINGLLGRFKESMRHEHELHLEKILNEKLRLAASVLEHSQEGILITDQDNRIIQVNPAFSRITGYSADEVIGENPRILASSRQDSKFYADMWIALSEAGYWQGEIWNRQKDGKDIPKWLSISVIRDPAGKTTNYVAIFADISERKQAEERIEFLAHHDPLTKLPNRVLLRDRFAHALLATERNGSGLALLFVDLDQFKDVNDGLGHLAGDRLLVETVTRLSNCVRDSDTICRLGGDEFIILLSNTQEVGFVTGVAQRILDAVSEPFDLGGETLGVTASIGVSLFPEDGEDFETLLGKADAAMYDVKTRGRNGYRFFAEEMNVETAERLHLRAMLQEAIQKNEFQLHYQPQINFETGRVEGIEALIRWWHPTMGNIVPDRFIPLAEESGLIIPIGEWVLMEACRQASELRRIGHEDLTVAVNISALQFSRGSIVDTVRKALGESGLPARLLELELTESALLHDIDGQRGTIQELKCLGVKLAIDDFGTGYSSLAYLKQIKVNKLKIDQSFVRDINGNSDDLAIVRAIIELGRTLQLSVIAEGIEDVEQLEILRRDGCSAGQGHLFSPPVPYSSLLVLLHDWRAPPQLSQSRQAHLCP